MTRYRATIVSPKGAAPKSSVIEFESEHRAGSKLNVQDARYKMLELHGSEALAWTVKDVEKVADSTPGDAPMEQMMLDFREPVEPPKRKRRTVKRGIAGLAAAITVLQQETQSCPTVHRAARVFV